MTTAMIIKRRFLSKLFTLFIVYNHFVHLSQAQVVTTVTATPTNKLTSNQTSEVLNKTKVIDTTNTTTTSDVLLSSDEFVDFTEAPTLLFDNTNPISHNETENFNSSSPSSQNDTSVTQSPLPDISNDISSTRMPPITSVKPNSEEESNENDTMVEEGVGEDIGGEEEDNKEDLKKPFEPPKNISQYMDYIENLFHDLRHQITDLFEPHIPQLIRTSQMVQLSGSCSYDMLRLALALRQFEPWALRMIDSSGKVPEGIFEGSFTALGSYDECLNTVFASTTSPPTGTSSNHAPYEKQPPLTQGKYCLVTVSPYLPPKPPTDRVERMFQEEANKRNYTKDDQFSRLSPMFYYMKFRIGVCIPSTCIDSDMDSISSALSSSLKLNITIPDCRVKLNQPFTSHQLVGGAIFALVVAVVVCATLLDWFRRKWDQIERQDIVMISVATHDKTNGLNGDGRNVILSNCLNEGSPKRSENFRQRLSKHWSWLSFSLLTNFKLYFKSKTISEPTTLVSHNKNLQEKTDSNLITCLNGIRVLSLCWVIVANSYITLDPRATKRLTKTREAPKDFVFQLVVQASLAIETFFFLSGVLMSLSFARRLKPKSSQAGQQSSDGTQTKLRWLHFYVHRYIRMTPATMLVIAFSMFAYHYGDGPLWFEATNKAHQSCSQNWWRHLLHVANFIDTRQMCFIHYWYIAADMQLFLFAPILMYLLYRYRRIGYALMALIGLSSIGSVFYITYMRNLPPTLLFYSSDPESRREFGNTIMTKPLTHALPYMVGMLVGQWLSRDKTTQANEFEERNRKNSLTTLFGTTAIAVALIEVFLPYKWNNSHLPTRLMAALYAALFRFGWSLVLAFVVISCQHKRGKKCNTNSKFNKINNKPDGEWCRNCKHPALNRWLDGPVTIGNTTIQDNNVANSSDNEISICLCGSGGNLMNRLLSLNIFAHLSKLSFVAYLIHLPLMSVFIGQTRGLFAFSHTLVIHLALSYLVMTFILSFILVHIIEFPFITFERYLFERLIYNKDQSNNKDGSCDNSDMVNKRTMNGYSESDSLGNATRLPHWTCGGVVERPDCSSNVTNRTIEGERRNFKRVSERL